MKTIISILIVIFGALGIAVKTSEDVHRSCNCSSPLCGCTVTCLDTGEIPNCICGVLTCICKCDPKDAQNPNDGPVPTMTSDQEANSIKSEGYFRGLGTGDGQTIANGIKALREAIKSGDSKKYYLNANTTESTFAKLPGSQQAAWENWANNNLKQ
ncbi:MAG TPA: hypothetical protein VGK46_07565 [Saprospiraceae bacterium]|jgi:hypothetical protein